MQKRAMFSFKKILAGEVASEIAEAALVLPLAFMILLGIYWFGRAFNTYATINHAAREGARAYIAQTCATCGNSPQSTATVASVITQAMQASAVDPSRIIQYPSTTPTAASCPGAPAPAGCSTSGYITFCNDVAITPSSNPTPQVCGVTVTFQYPYQFWLPFTSLNNRQIILTADVQMMGEY